ncbi:MAG: RIP metalloprotease RseP [Peptostreptococcaceae bacterium]
MTIIAAILLFGLIVFIHELGHFLFARRAGVTIHEFAIGMGPKVFGTERDGIKYSIRLLPLGGYVSMEGEEGDSNDPNAFGNKTIGQRAATLFAGPFFNIILAALLLIPVNLYIGSPTGSNVLGQVMEGAPAFEIGLKSGDEIVDINGNEIKTWDDVTKYIHNSNGEELNITVVRDGSEKSFNVTPIKNEQGTYVIGIGQTFEKNVLEAITGAFVTTWEMIKQMVMFVGQLITGTVPGGAENAVAGPIGVIGIVSDAAKMGLPNLLYIASVISLNLGVLNLLPIPALDGGRLVMLAIEAVRGGKKMDPNKEAMLHMAGFFLLMGLMVFVTYKDIMRLF